MRGGTVNFYDGRSTLSSSSWSLAVPSRRRRSSQPDHTTDTPFSMNFDLRYTCTSEPTERSFDKMTLSFGWPPSYQHRRRNAVDLEGHIHPTFVRGVPEIYSDPVSLQWHNDRSSMKVDLLEFAYNLKWILRVWDSNIQLITLKMHQNILFLQKIFTFKMKYTPLPRPSQSHNLLLLWHSTPPISTPLFRHSEL